ncbi:Pectate trisaccharide-lyase [Paramyrothecium foliicola]|nr:Pectate trisaccharide-lyase [Paramyrothecium foliicola]
MKSIVAALTVFTATAFAGVTERQIGCKPLWTQCGGNGYAGAACCAAGACTYLNQWHSQCLDNSGPEIPSPTPSVPEAACTQSANGFASLNGGTTGGAGGTVITVDNQMDLERYASSAGKYVIKVSGKINISPFGKEIKVTDDKTIIGLGDAGEIHAGGFYLTKAKNVIIRNLKIGNTRKASSPNEVNDRDGIQADASSNIWIDHCIFENGGDRLIQFRSDTTFWTVSNSIFRNHDKAFSTGWTENVVAQGTVHSNLFNGTNDNPSLGALAQAHLYNNHVYNVTSSGHYIQGTTTAVIENVFFEFSNRAIQADGAARLGTSGNIFKNCTGTIARDQGWAFAARQYYNYTMIRGPDVPAHVSANAGPRVAVCPS